MLSVMNGVSQELVNKRALTVEIHPKSYQVACEWRTDLGDILMQVDFIEKYTGRIWCDVLPMTVGNIIR